ncbi:hypothetical protein [Rhizorhapis sp.]|uniref:hypothetical protein n=1 Tax=Rhizorhapis sp. TaxID=1968842 RepID=UPI002B45B7B0|nr:hypothetical protein [Rhizorhapis sp.]HKR18468.1 hypothetical protein [Rhizorhapis sp.]
MKRLIIIAAAGFALSHPVMAQEREPAGAVDDGSVKINQLIVYGDDPCPESTSDQITVCARKSERERFRIPEALRDDPNKPANQSWTNRAEALEYVGRSGTDSCSPVGAGGFTGCFAQLMREARAERMGSDNVSWARLVEAERQKRLEKLDAEAEAIEQQLRAQEKSGG